MLEQRSLLISRLGAQGDGVVDAGGAPIFVPFALPGETVTATVVGDRAALVDVLTSSADRVAPVCRHFGTCGGCSAQHMARELYRDWKRELVTDAFRARGLDIDVAPLVQPGGNRRRATFSAKRNGTEIVLGFHEAASHTLVQIDECPVLEPKIVAALPEFSQLIKPLISNKGEARVTATWTNAGLDVEIGDIEKQLSLAIRSTLAAEATSRTIVRLAVNGDIVYETLAPNLTFGSVDVPIPLGVFLQAVAAAEAELANRCVAAIGKAKSVVDLFSGLGTLTFPLAAKARISAFDGDANAIAALVAAAKTGKGLKPISTCVRDLFREPLSPLELGEHEAIVFDPPRAGAEAQVKKIAKSKVKTVCAISCNPATLARDARHLVDGGYKIESITPIDQFVYSAHVEVVAVFRR